jgi:hypothetical protein
MNRCTAFANPNSRMLSLTPSGYQNFPPKISLKPTRTNNPGACAIIESSLEPRRHYQVLPGASTSSFPTTVEAPSHAAIFPDLCQWHRRPQRHRPQACDVVPEPTTMSSSLIPWRCAPHAIPEPTTPSSSTCLRRRRPREVPESMMPTYPCHPRARNAIILPEPARLHCIFFFVILGLEILILICYIATLLLYATLLLFYCIALMCYIATLLWCAILPHCIDMLHCL